MTRRERIEALKQFSRQLLCFLAWEAGELCEGEAAKFLQCDRVTARELKAQAIKGGVDNLATWKSIIDRN
jgi:hypothetical protein